MPYTLFNPVEILRVPISLDPRSRLLRSLFEKDIANVKKYYSVRPQFLNNSHILIKLINLLDKGVDETFNECYSRVSKTYRNPCSSLGISTYGTVGVMHDGEFYQNTQEYIVATDRFFAVSSMATNWQLAQPVKVLCHEVKKLNFIQPGPLCYCDSAGYSVVEINPVLLACMYKAFCEDAISKAKLGYACTPKEFITRFVFPNMLDKHMDLVVANRASDLSGGKSIQSTLDINRRSIKQPFYIYTKASQIDDSLLYQIKNLSGKTASAQQTLSNITTYSYTNLFHLFAYKPIYRAVQLDWVYCLVFLKYFDILSHLSKNDGLIKRSKGHLYQLAKEFIRNNAIGMAIKMAYKQKDVLYPYIVQNRLVELAALSGSASIRNVLIINKLVQN